MAPRRLSGTTRVARSSGRMLTIRTGVALFAGLQLHHSDVQHPASRRHHRSRRRRHLDGSRGRAMAAVVGVSTALVIRRCSVTRTAGTQAIGANCLNCRLLAHLWLCDLPASGRRPPRLRPRGPRSSRVIRGINVPPSLAAVELGLQPLLWTRRRAPYTLTAWRSPSRLCFMAHLTVAGFAEAL